ncbi:ABC transporter permease [Halalkalibacter alkalisediminis]|uniref:ABC transporter permease n=1 Tax=Halalkalibacter alkalisediminis TaxID=935616 RepID=A0ABV6NJ92_9BACI|nr:ABC transporter permease subunit [Halalkalibacter alkalisediminis]
MLKIIPINLGIANGIGIILLMLLILVGLFAPWLSPHDPLAINVANRLHSPNWDYPFGTDHVGRCILSRMMYGIRTTVTTAFLIMVFTLIISIPIGLITGYIRGRSDHLIMRMVDGTLALPDIILTIAIVGILGPGFLHMIVAIVVVRWANYVRFIRSLVLKIGNEDFIRTARISGNSHLKILKHYILPFILSPIIIFGALDMGRIVLLIAGLSFLGLGAQPPTPEWGVMLNDATAYFQIAPHVMIFPGLAIMLFVLGCQLISERGKTNDTWV